MPEEIIPIKDNAVGKIVDVQFTGFSIEYSIGIDGKTVKSLLATHPGAIRFEINDEVGLSLLTSKIRLVNES